MKPSDTRNCTAACLLAHFVDPISRPIVHSPVQLFGDKFVAEQAFHVPDKQFKLTAVTSCLQVSCICTHTQTREKADAVMFLWTGMSFEGRLRGPDVVLNSPHLGIL